MKKDNFDNKNAGSRKTALMTSAKSSEERFARQLGKLGSSIFIIIVAMYFKIPDRVQNLYLMIALLMLIYQPMFRTVSGLLKLICPAGDYDKEIVRKCLEYALEVRRRVSAAFSSSAMT